MKAEVVVADVADETDRNIIQSGLRASNAEAAGPSRVKPVAILLRDPESGRTLGGLWGKTLYDWMFVEMLFVPDTLRGLGLGSKLIAQAERIAAERDCVGLWLDTFEFQAPAFYRKLGFEECGLVDDHPLGMNRYFFRKRLAAKA
jgi:GNAT superfamily N-acetyltransferase